MPAPTPASADFSDTGVSADPAAAPAVALSHHETERLSSVAAGDLGRCGSKEQEVPSALTVNKSRRSRRRTSSSNGPADGQLAALSQSSSLDSGWQVPVAGSDTAAAAAALHMSANGSGVTPTGYQGQPPFHATIPLELAADLPPAASQIQQQSSWDLPPVGFVQARHSQKATRQAAASKYVSNAALCGLVSHHSDADHASCPGHPVSLLNTGASAAAAPCPATACSAGSGISHPRVISPGAVNARAILSRMLSPVTAAPPSQPQPFPFSPPPTPPPRPSPTAFSPPPPPPPGASPTAVPPPAPPPWSPPRTSVPHHRMEEAPNDRAALRAVNHALSLLSGMGLLGSPAAPASPLPRPVSPLATSAARISCASASGPPLQVPGAQCPPALSRALALLSRTAAGAVSPAADQRWTNDKYAGDTADATEEPAARRGHGKQQSGAMAWSSDADDTAAMVSQIIHQVELQTVGRLVPGRATAQAWGQAGHGAEMGHPCSAASDRVPFVLDDVPAEVPNRHAGVARAPHPSSTSAGVLTRHANGGGQQAWSAERPTLAAILRATPTLPGTSGDVPTRPPRAPLTLARGMSASSAGANGHAAAYTSSGARPASHSTQAAGVKAASGEVLASLADGDHYHYAGDAVTDDVDEAPKAEAGVFDALQWPPGIRRPPAAAANPVATPTAVGSLAYGGDDGAWLEGLEPLAVIEATAAAPRGGAAAAASTAATVRPNIMSQGDGATSGSKASASGRQHALLSQALRRLATEQATPESHSNSNCPATSPGVPVLKRLAARMAAAAAATASAPATSASRGAPAQDAGRTKAVREAPARSGGSVCDLGVRPSQALGRRGHKDRAGSDSDVQHRRNNNDAAVVDGDGPYSGVNRRPFDMCSPAHAAAAGAPPASLTGEKKSKGRRDTSPAAPAAALRSASPMPLVPTKPKELPSGLVLLKEWLTMDEQVAIVSSVRALGRGLGGFYTPMHKSGNALNLKLMCLGMHWEALDGAYETTRSRYDNAVPPPIPVLLTEACNRSLKDASTMASSSGTQMPFMAPDVCLCNFYNPRAGRLGLHQDKDEERETLHQGLPVVSLSIGDAADFVYSPTRDEEAGGMVRLESGDALVFGGPSRMLFHSVPRIYAGTAPDELLRRSNMRPGRLNLTFRQLRASRTG